MAIDPSVPAGPIPGENFTSDTKNYAWHRPPDYTNLNEAFEFAVEQVLDEDTAVSIITMLEMGTPVVPIVDMIVTAGIGGGKWTPDYAMILSGPLAHVICLMARRYGIEDIRLGTTDGKKRPKTKAYFDAFKKVDSDLAGESAEDIASALGVAGDGKGAVVPGTSPGSNIPSTGLGGMPTPPAEGSTDDQPVSPEGEQAAMLGQAEGL